MPFIKELKRLGLKDKEASIYLTCLQLGPSPAQQISGKSGVVRATTYVVLESLMQRGLITQYKEGKKTLFSAEPPSQLVRLVEKRQDELEERKHELELLLPELQMLMKAGEGKPSVRYFEGVEGLRSIRREMVMYSEEGDTWNNFTPIDYLEAVIGHHQEESYYRQRVAKGIKVKTIFSTRSPKLRSEMLEGHKDALSERKYVSSKLFPSPSGMTIFRDRIAIGSFKGKVGGVVIESSNMADMMRQLFGLAWIGIGSLDEK
jgi:HTH-type transcriptional regulator, sugar sensing transcriptional regulator